MSDLPMSYEDWRDLQDERASQFNRDWIEEAQDWYTCKGCGMRLIDPYDHIESDGTYWCQGEKRDTDSR